MRIAKEEHSLDVIAEAGDEILIEIQKRSPGLVLYVHMSGRTILRVCRLTRDQISQHDAFTIEMLSP